MKRIHVLLTLSSLNVLFVTIERFSFTTKVLLQPYDFLRLHEVFQILILILFTVLIPFFLLYEVTGNFEDLKPKKGVILGVLFIIGVYLYATGNGIHELASFFFNSYCPTEHVSTIQCNGMFFNDYYFGNILYFIGAVFMSMPILLFERNKPRKVMKKNDIVFISINAIVYSLAIFAYAAFDKVLVGLVYSVVFMIIADYLFVRVKNNYRKYPLITYSAFAYTLGTIAAIIVRFH